MSSFIISLDSVYRDVFLYNNPADYDIIINPYTPSLTKDGANKNFTVDNPIFTAFQWRGLVTFPTTALGYPKTIPLNARQGRCAQVFGRDTFGLAASEAVQTVDYYVGTLFVFFLPTAANQTPGEIPRTYETGIISGYDPTTNRIRLQTGMDLTFLISVFEATQNNPTYKNYYIIDTSFAQGNNLILLGLNSFLSDSDQNYVSDISLQTAPTTDMWVQNVTRGWITSMAYLESVNRNAFLNPPGGASTADFSGDLGDTYLLRKTDSVFSVQTTGSPVPHLVVGAVIVDGGTGYTVGSVYTVYTTGSPPTDTGMSIRVRQVDPQTLGIVAYDWASRAAAVVGTMLQVGLGGSPASMRVVEVAELAIPISVDDGRRIQQYAVNTSFTVFIPIPQQLILNSFAHYDTVIYTVSGAFLCIDQYVGSTVLPTGTFLQLVSYSPRLVGVIAPTIGYQQGVCYKVRLLSLVLPNQPLRGINQLPSFFPYFMLQLYNTNRITGSTNILYANNPHTQRVAFFCPVGNPRNQIVSSYVVVRSTQENFIKWSSLGSLHIQVVLPDGTTLLYAENAKVAELAASYEEQGLPYQSFILTLMNQIYEPHIVATFEFQIMT